MTFKSPGLYLMFLFGCTSAVQGQTSYKCYSPPKEKARLAIGLRTGVSREFSKTYAIDELNSKNRSWSQQLYLQCDISRHFMLELDFIHQRSWRDLSSFTAPVAGRTYNKVLTKNQRLHTNMILHYLVPQPADQIRVGIGGGLGFIFSQEQYQETYNESGNAFRHVNKNYKLEAPNLIVAITGAYQIKKRLSVSAQCAYSVLVGGQMGHLHLNAGLEYQL